MKTEIIREIDALGRAAALLWMGELVAVPTETVYGLAGNGLDENAVRGIYEVKGRPETKPLSLMVPGVEAMERYCEDVPAQAKALAARFWPGPLTIVLKAKPLVPEIVRAGGDTVGLRCPDHPMTLALLRLADIPFAAPSANPSGMPSPTSAEDVAGWFDGRIAAIVDGGPCGIGRESTLLLMTEAPYRILRQGALSEASIADALVDSMTLIGITGPSGCGKTSALEEVARQGGLTIDCDTVYHRLLEENGALLRELDGAFPGVVTQDRLDRGALAALVFSDPAALALLNTITHRYVAEEVQRLLRDWAMRGGTLAAVDAIELISSGLGARCTAVVGILADPELRVGRIMARDGISREAALLRIRAQRDDAYFRENCDIVLENNGDADAFKKAFQRVIKEIQTHD